MNCLQVLQEGVRGSREPDGCQQQRNDGTEGFHGAECSRKVHSALKPFLDRLFSFQRFSECRTIRPGMSLFDLRGEVAVVIGATGVLGGALAEGLAEAGASIAVVGRNTERGEARVKAIAAAGGKARFFRADAIRREELGAAI